MQLYREYSELQFLSDCDPVRAAELLTLLLVKHPGVMEHAMSAQIIAQALNWSGEAQALQWIDCFSAHDHPISQQAAAELLALRHYCRPEELLTASRLHRALEDPSSLAPDADRVQLGIAHIAVRLWQEPEQWVHPHHPG